MKYIAPARTLRQNLYCAMMVCSALIWSQNAMAIEEPAYEVLRSDAPFEIRRYPALLVAETVVEGDMDQASNQGFRRIADFIFGNNQLPGTGQASRIAMTAPVTVEPQSGRIAMTAPVTVEPDSPDANMAQATRWRIHFVMPRLYTLDTLPRPRNADVQVREIPPRYMVVHRYSWLNTASRVQQKTDETLAWAQRQSLNVIGVPQLARYDPPIMPPMFRRNEIHLEIEKP
ncbi:MAG: hypothetical protein RIT26_2154 [Pseudomonadota bacterium]|jgi:hypothetical protein